MLSRSRLARGAKARLKLWANDPRREGQWRAILMAFGLFVVLTVALLPKQATTFRIDAQTRAISIQPSADHPAWPAGEGGLAVEPVPAGCDAQSFRATEGAKIDFITGPDARASMTISAAKSAGEFTCFGGVQPAAADVAVTNLLRLGEKSPVVLRFVGKATVGRDIEIGDLSPPMLSGGQVIVETLSVPFPTAKVETSHDLQPGDRVQFLTAPASPGMPQEQAISAGIIIVAGDGTARLLSRTRAREASVMRFGRADGEAVAYSPTWLSRFQASAEYVIFLPIAWLLAKLAQALGQAFRMDGTSTRQQARFVQRVRRLLSRTPMWAIPLLLLTGVSANSASAQEQPRPARLMIDDVTAQALVFRAQGGCRALTAYHAVRNVDAARLRLQNGAVVMAERREHAGDIALLEIAAGSEETCARLPTNNEIQRSLDQNDFQLRQVGQTGLARLPLSIRGETATTLVFAALNDADRVRLEQGVSGSPIFAGQIPIAIATDLNVEAGEVVAVRIDSLRALLPALQFEPIPAPPGTTNLQAEPTNAPAAQPVDMANLDRYLNGRDISFFSPVRLQAMGPIGGSLVIKDGALLLGRLEFTLDDEYLGNQPESMRAVPGIKFQICARITKRDMKQGTDPQCLSGFKYSPGVKYSSGISPIEFDIKDVCSESELRANQCMLWIYYVQDGQDQGQGGAHPLSYLIATGRAS